MADVEAAWRAFESRAREHRVSLTHALDVKHPARFGAAFRFGRRSYRVKCDDPRRFAACIRALERLGGLRGRDALAGEIGLLRAFGEIFAPPIGSTVNALAQRFKIPASTVRSYLARYRRLT